MEKIVVVIMGQNCERNIGMCLESVKSADDIVYCDGGSVDNTLNIVSDFKLKEMKWKHTVGVGSEWNWHPEVIENEYNQEDPKMNGKQRNFYLNYVKEMYPDYWCLALDADEVVDDFNKIREICEEGSKNPNLGGFCVKMRHFIGDLGNEDATVNTHFVLNRLFKVSKAGSYQEVEHPVLSILGEVYNTIHTTIWHLAYIPNLWEIKKRYENHLKKSNMHTPEFLKWWYKSHLFGTYPKKSFNPEEIPNLILKNFGLDLDEFYFENRKQIEFKHILDAIYLRDFLESMIKEPKVMEVGCGMGIRVWSMNAVKLNAYGNEISKYAVENSLYKPRIKFGDITESVNKIDDVEFDLIMAYDVLEHLKYEDLDKSINNLINNTKRFIILSIPYKGTHNADADKTHIIKEDRTWWVNKFLEKGLKEVEVPSYFLFRDQLLLFEK